MQNSRRNPKSLFTSIFTKHFHTARLTTLMVVLIWTPAAAYDVTLAWDPNQEDSVEGYMLYYGTHSRVYTNNYDVGSHDRYSVKNLAPGQTYYFSITAYDADGNESSFSSEVSFKVPYNIVPLLSILLL